jgi:hypothetical protein
LQQKSLYQAVLLTRWPWMLLLFALQVSVLVEGQSMTLTQLAQHISSMLSGGSSSGSGPVDGETSAAEGQADAAAAAAAAPAAVGSSEVAVTALAVRNIIQDVASRKSYGLQDGECCCLRQNNVQHEAAASLSRWSLQQRSYSSGEQPFQQPMP